MAIMGGKVGINTTSPSHTLTVKSTDNETLRLIGSQGSFGWGAKLNFGDYDYAYIQEYIDDELTIYSRLGTAILGGNVGIGTTNSENALHVNGAINLDPRSEPSNPTTGFVIYCDSADGKLKAKSSAGTVSVLANP